MLKHYRGFALPDTFSFQQLNRKRISETQHTLKEGRGENATPSVTAIHKPASEAGGGEGRIPEESFPGNNATESRLIYNQITAATGDQVQSLMDCRHSSGQTAIINPLTFIPSSETSAIALEKVLVSAGEGQESIMQGDCCEQVINQHQFLLLTSTR
uniref:Uncharacterized protein n=1 Tax=Myotis myotis TaxID=51298 RepID=A0A7J7WVS7_MYOMY|nr:hypothetical protein mMyoMyo1_011913 [Myotis myotis]